MIRRPPRSTLFPYTSSSDLIGRGYVPRRLRLGVRSVGVAMNGTRAGRSEEHTSELQSQSNLVCRLFFCNDTAPTEIYPLSLHELFRSHRPGLRSEEAPTWGSIGGRSNERNACR